MKGWNEKKNYFLLFKKVSISINDTSETRII